MAMLQPQTLPLVRTESARKPVMPSTVRPLPPPARAFQVLQAHRAPTQLSLFSPPAAQQLRGAR